jgi:ketosteroid isomerase-like protein
MSKNLTCILIAALAFSCGQPESKHDEGSTDTTSAATTAPPAFDLQAARSTVESVNAKFMEDLKKGDSAALATHYSSDAVLMFDNSEPQTGAGIQSMWGGAIRSGVKELKIATTDLVGNADLLAETGTYEMIGANNKSLDKGKYVVVWKQESGTWKIYRDIANSNLPAHP